MKSNKISLLILVLEVAAIVYLHASRPLNNDPANLASGKMNNHTQLNLSTPPVLFHLK